MGKYFGTDGFRGEAGIKGISTLGGGKMKTNVVAGGEKIKHLA